MAILDSLSTVSKLLIAAGSRIWTGNSLPATPSDNDLWLDSRYGSTSHTNIYNSSQSVWFGERYFKSIPMASFTANNQFVDSVIPVFFYGISTTAYHIHRIYGVFNSTGTANSHSATDFYQFVLEAMDSAGTWTTIHTISANTQGMTSAPVTNIRRFGDVPNIYLHGNYWCYRLRSVKTGTLTIGCRVHLEMEISQIRT